MKLIVKENEDGELYIELPPELLEKMGWDEGTNMVFIVETDGTIILRESRENDSSNQA